MTKARDLANASTALSAVSATELAFLDGVTSAIQTQIDTKAPSSTAVTLTGTETLTNKTLTSPVIASVVNNTLTSTTGDMIYASAANTPARLGIGSTDQILKVTGGVPAWATPASGGMTLLSTTSLSSGASITVSSIDQTYYSLYVLVQRANISSAGGLQIKPNASNIAHNSYLINATAANLTYGGIVLAPTSLTLSASETFNGWSIYIDNYADTANDRTKPFNCYGQYYRNNDTLNSINNAGGIFTSGAITSLEILPSAGSFQGGTMFIYGVK